VKSRAHVVHFRDPVEAIVVLRALAHELRVRSVEAATPDAIAVLIPRRDAEAFVQVADGRANIEAGERIVSYLEQELKEVAAA
jgi:hypothetical protein